METPEAHRERGKKYYLANKENILAKRKLRGRPDTATNTKYTSRWRKKNPEKARILRRKYAGFKEPTRARPDFCECCGKPPDGKYFTGGKRELNYDHCHETNEFRGWLCWSCNTAIGKLGDNVTGVQKALDYLIKTSGNAA